MVFKCCVPNCVATDVQTHSFPKNENYAQKWITAVKLFDVSINKKTAWNSYYQVCHKHFKKEDYTSNCFRFLKKGVIPSLEVPVSNAVTEHNYCDPTSVLLAPNSQVEISGQKYISDDVQRQRADSIDNNNASMVREIHFDGCLKLLAMDELTLNQSEWPTTNAVRMGDDENSITQDCVADAIYVLPLNDCDKAMESDEVSLVQDFVTLTDCEDDDFDRNTESVSMVTEMQLDELMELFGVDGSTLSECDEGTKDDISMARNFVSLTDDESEMNYRSDAVHRDTENHTEDSNQKSSRPYDPIARKLKYQSTRMKFLKKRVRELENPKNSTLMNYLSSRLTPEQTNFVQMMLRNSGKKKQAWRFTKDDKNFAMSAYKQSPKAYRHYRDYFGGPGKKTIYEHAAYVRFEAGINPKLLNFIKSAVNNLKDREKYVTVSWDEMSLQTHLDFNTVKDYIDGFVDYGDHREQKFGTHALVFMVRGVTKEFKQPVAYFITENISSGELSELIRLVIEAILDTGLKVVGSVCDAVQTNRSAVNKLRSQLTKTEIIEYTIRDSKIIHVYDPPHLLKSLRNNLLVKNLKHSVNCSNEDDNLKQRKERTEYDRLDSRERIASWADVTDFYGYSRKCSERLLPNITGEHIKPVKRKMKVNVAAQVFSRTYGRAMRIYSVKQQPKTDFTGTADILCFFNDVFDSLNGGGAPKPNTLMGSINESSYHFEFWEYAVEMIKKMKFETNNEKKDASFVLSDYIVTIKGLSELTKRMLKITDTVSLRRTTQDALENFFGGIRSIIYSPSVREFRGAFASMVVNNLCSKHSIDSNCEADDGIPLLQNFYVMLTSTPGDESTGGITVEKENYEQFEESAYTDEYKSLMLSANEALDYAAGDACQKLLKNVKCVSCRNLIQTLRNGISSYPSESFLKCFNTLVIHGKKVLPTVCMKRQLKEGFGREIEFQSKISCMLHENEIKNKLLDVTFKYLVLNFTKDVNRMLHGKDDESLPSNPIEEQALQFYMKKKNIGKYKPSVQQIDLSVPDVKEKSVIKKPPTKKPIIRKNVIKKDSVKKPSTKMQAIKKKANKKDSVEKPLIKNIKKLVPQIRITKIAIDKKGRVVASTK